MPFTLSDSTYAKLKWLVAIVLPAFTAFYVGLAQIYNWGNAEAVAGTVALLTAFLGTLLGVTSYTYNKNDVADGQIVVTEKEDGMSYSLQLEKTPEELAQMRRVTFKVEPQ
jgi:hypothetical protein